MNILDTIIKENERKKIEDKMLICRRCNRKMQDNSFMHGSRKAGSYNCVCGFEIMF